MRPQAIIAATLIATAAFADQTPDHVIRADILKPQAAFQMRDAAGSTPTVQLFLLHDGTNWPHMTNGTWGGKIFYYGTNWASTTWVEIASSSYTSNSMFYSFTTADTATNGTFVMQMVVTNDAGKVYRWANGELTLDYVPPLIYGGIGLDLTFGGTEYDPLWSDSSNAVIQHITNAANPHLVGLEQARTANNKLAGDIDFNGNAGTNVSYIVLNGETILIAQEPEIGAGTGTSIGPIVDGFQCLNFSVLTNTAHGTVLLLQDHYAWSEGETGYHHTIRPGTNETDVEIWMTNGVFYTKGGTIRVTADGIFPGASNTVDIGSELFPFRSGYFAAETLHIGSQSLSQGDIGTIKTATQTLATITGQLAAVTGTVGQVQTSLATVSNLATMATNRIPYVELDMIDPQTGTAYTDFDLKIFEFGESCNLLAAWTNSNIFSWDSSWGNAAATPYSNALYAVFTIDDARTADGWRGHCKWFNVTSNWWPMGTWLQAASRPEKYILRFNPSAYATVSPTNAHRLHAIWMRSDAAGNVQTNSLGQEKWLPLEIQFRDEEKQ